MKIEILNGHFNFGDFLKAIPEDYRPDTRVEVQKMLDETKYHFDAEKEEGVFVYSDGREIRLPAKGWKNLHGNVRGAGKEGNYWLLESEEIPSSSDAGAWRLHFCSSNACLNYRNRAHRFSVYYVAK